MAEEKPSLHIDTDWKRQAQEEKKRLAEQEAKRAAERGATPAGIGSVSGVSPSGETSSTAMPGAPLGAATRGAAAAEARGREGHAAASLSSLIQSILTQILFYLGDLSTRGAEPAINLDMAKTQLDILGILESKTKGNLDEQEKRMLDTALYEGRMRFVSVASQFIS